MTKNFSEVTRNQRSIGFEFTLNNVLFFFGQKDVPQELLSEHYPQLKFTALKQVHGTHLVKAASEVSEADAHWTTARNVALRISTADCIPLLISHPKFICAIHAGWRGVHAGITPLALAQLFEQFGNSIETLIALGPHIGPQSFEVDRSLGEELVSRAKMKYSTSIQIIPTAEPNKAFVDLSAIVRAQLLHLGISENQIIELDFDTKTDKRFHSYRREKHSGTRNYSFIARL